MLLEDKYYKHTFPISCDENNIVEAHQLYAQHELCRILNKQSMFYAFFKTINYTNSDNKQNMTINESDVVSYAMKIHNYGRTTWALKSCWGSVTKR